ncbi:iron complex transport system ATP-binding protein [Arcanobacterium pluranimalium]|uniref:ABC transporter ATP-binding protein n=1 Tax=Arcanobacterium pluranimalium TaxID=108028 RepID=UPI00195ED0DD|nr:ABC transporter ATP-binding protein [Arcanobacterium pluranimalium]MBM7825781.1 iron complex transport system ATP-binding protein [Arcanobacterium pluranimalium]
MSDFPLSVFDATVRFGRFTALNAVSFHVKPGRILGIAGPNGSGKTTLLRSLFGAQKLTEGKIEIGGKALDELPAAEVGRRLSVVSQFESDSDHLRVGEFVLLGRVPQRRDFQGYCVDDKLICQQALEKVDMGGSQQRYFQSLSGGERQRVMIARALSQQCPCMLFDEPTNHLDVKFQHQILQLIRSVATTAVIILHDLNLVARYCDDVIIMRDGAIIQQGTPQDVLNAQLIRSVYGMDAKVINDAGTKQFIFR